jgi:hypothetical protein
MEEEYPSIFDNDAGFNPYTDEVFEKDSRKKHYTIIIQHRMNI